MSMSLSSLNLKSSSCTSDEWCCLMLIGNPCTTWPCCLRIFWSILPHASWILFRPEITWAGPNHFSRFKCFSCYKPCSLVKTCSLALVLDFKDVMIFSHDSLSTNALHAACKLRMCLAIVSDVAQVTNEDRDEERTFGRLLGKSRNNFINIEVYW